MESLQTLQLNTLPLNTLPFNKSSAGKPRFWCSGLKSYSSGCRVRASVGVQGSYNWGVGWGYRDVVTLPDVLATSRLDRPRSFKYGLAQGENNERLDWVAVQELELSHHNGYIQ